MSITIATGVSAVDALGGGAGRGLQSPGVLRPTGTASPVTGTVNKTTLATIPLRAGLIGPNGGLRIWTLWSFTNNANAKTITIEIGGNALFSVNAASNGIFQHVLPLYNRGVVNSQVQYPNFATAPFGFGSATNNTWSIDFGSAQTLIITGQLANAADTITLDAYVVEVLNP